MGRSIITTITLPQIILKDMRMLRHDIAWEIAKSNTDRVRKQKDLVGKTIEPNAPGWKRRKQRLGYSTQPLVMTGKMTEPFQSFRVTDDGKYTVIKGDSRTNMKYSHIQAQSRGRRTWLNAYGIGDTEVNAANRDLEKHIQQQGLFNVKRSTKAG